MMEISFNKRGPSFFARLLVLLFFCCLHYFYMPCVTTAMADTSDNKELFSDEFKRRFPIEPFKSFPLKTCGVPGWSLAVSNNYIFAASTDNRVICIESKTGSTKWEQALSKFDRAILDVGKRCVFILVDFKKLYAFDLYSGIKKWDFSVGSGLGLFTYANGLVFAGGQNNKVYALDEISGDIVWQDNLHSSITAKPAVIGNVCCFGSDSGLLRAYNIADGKAIWNIHLQGGIELPIGTVNNNFLVLSKDDKVTAISADTGGKCWQADVRVNFEPPFSNSDKAVIFGKFGSFGQYYIQILNGLTGDIIWRFSHSSQLQCAPVFINDYMICTTDQNLCVYDLRKGYELFSIDTVPGLCIISDANQIFFGVADKGIWQTKINPTLLVIHPNASDLFSFWKGPLCLIIFLIGLVILVLIFLLPGHAQIPPTYETFLHIHILTILYLVISLVNAYVALIIIKCNHRCVLDIYSLLMATLLLMPLLIMLFSFYLFHRTGKRKLTTQAYDDNDGSSLAVWPVVRDLCSSMKIPCPASIVFSSDYGTSPFIVGSSQHRWWLVLPSNFIKLISDVCDNVPRTVDGLKRAILAHEMAHVKNKDIFWLPILWAICRPLKWYLAVTTFYYLFLRYVVNDRLMIYIGSTLIIINLLAWLFMRIASWSLLRERENLADATAALYVDPNTMSVLAMPDQSGLSPLEKLLFTFSAAAMFTHSYFGFSKPYRHPSSLKSIFSDTIKTFRRKLELRLKGLISKDLMVSGKYLPTWKAVIFVGIVTAFLFSYLCVVKYYAFIDYSLSTQTGTLSDFSAIYLKAVDGWASAIKDSILWNELPESLLKFFVCFIGATLLLIPLREGVESAKPVKTSEMLNLTICALLCYFVFTMASSIINDLAIRPLLRFTFMELSFRFMFIGFIAALFILAGLLPVLARSQTHRGNLFLIEVSIGVLSVFLPGLVILTFGTKLPLFSRLLLWLCAAQIVSISDKVWYLFIRSEDLKTEGIKYWRFLWHRKLIVFRCWRISPNDLRDIIVPTMYFVTTFLLPISIICMVIYPHLVRFDNWYFENIGRLNETMHELSATAVSRISAGTWDSHTKFQLAWLYIFSSYVRPEGIFPSNIMLIVPATFLCLLLAAKLSIKILTGRSKRTRFIQEMPVLMEIGEILACKLTFRYYKYLEDKILPSICVNKPFIRGVEGVSLMRTTCVSLFLMRQYKADLHCKEKVQIILRGICDCESVTGGFAAKPGMQPDILHTNAALRLTGFVENICNKIIKEKHSSWLLEQLTRYIQFDNQFSSNDWLSAVDSIVTSMACIGVSDKISYDYIDKIGTIAVAKWRRGFNSIVCTRHILSILKNLGLLFKNDVTKEIRSTWLPPRERTLPHLSPRHKLERIANLLIIVKILYPESYLDRESIVQLKDNFNKIYAGDARTGLI